MQTQNRFIQMSALALGIAGALAVGQAQASGFQLKENSVKAMGRAFAGSGVATGDASVVVNNPATMTSFEGTTIQADVTVVDLNADFDGGGYAATGTPLVRPLTGSDGLLLPLVLAAPRWSRGWSQEPSRQAHLCFWPI